MANFSATYFLLIIIAIIEAAPLSYKFTNETFDFDSTPDSIEDKAYRFEMNTVGVSEFTGQCVDKEKRLDLWFAFKLKKAKDDVKTELLAIYDFQETIEDELLNALVNIESMVQETLASKLFEDYLVINIGFNFTYGRTL